MPISTTAISVSSLEPAEREREADLVVLAPLRDDRRARADAQSAPRMSFVEVFAVEPVTATTFALERSRTARPSAPRAPKASSGTSAAAAPASSASLDEVDAAADGDEEVARLDPARVDARRRSTRSAPRAPLEPTGRKAFDLGERERDHAAAPSRRSASRATSRSSNGIVPVAELLALLVPLPGDDDDVALVGLLDGARDRGGAVRLDLLRRRSCRRGSRR